MGQCAWFSSLGQRLWCARSRSACMIFYWVSIRGVLSQGQRVWFLVWVSVRGVLSLSPHEDF